MTVLLDRATGTDFPAICPRPIFGTSEAFAIPGKSSKAAIKEFEASFGNKLGMGESDDCSPTRSHRWPQELTFQPSAPDLFLGPSNSFAT